MGTCKYGRACWFSHDYCAVPRPSSFVPDDEGGSLEETANLAAAGCDLDLDEHLDGYIDDDHCSDEAANVGAPVVEELATTTEPLISIALISLPAADSAVGSAEAVADNAANEQEITFMIVNEN